MSDEEALAEAVAGRVEEAIEVAFAETGAGADPPPDLGAVAADPLAALVVVDPTAVDHDDLAWAAEGGGVLLGIAADAPAEFDDDFAAAALAAARAGYWVMRAWYAERPWPAAAGPAPADGAWRAAEVRARLDVSGGFLTTLAEDWYRITCDLPGALLDRLLVVARAHLDGHEVHEVFALKAGDLREGVVELVSIGAAVGVLELAALHHLGGPSATQG